MARQIVIHPGMRIALRQLHYRGELLHDILLTYHNSVQGFDIAPWHYEEPPHTRYYSGSWRLVEEAPAPLLVSE